jgi:hypothetical protein
MGALMVALSGSIAGAMRINADSGGQIGAYLDYLTAVRKSGERVIIDGPCLSACTIVLGVIPRNRICVTSRAQLGFHAAWDRDSYGRPITSQIATRLLEEMYPKDVRNWLAKQGGLSTQMKYLAGPELAAMFQTCP